MLKEVLDLALIHDYGQTHQIYSQIPGLFFEDEKQEERDAIYKLCTRQS